MYIACACVASDTYCPFHAQLSDEVMVSMYKKMSLLCYMDQHLYKAQRMVSYAHNLQGEDIPEGERALILRVLCAGPHFILYDVLW